LHRPRDLVRPADRLASPAAVNEPQNDGRERSYSGTGKHAFHRVADRKTGGETAQDA
jgi:hypothetical protein